MILSEVGKLEASLFAQWTDISSQDGDFWIVLFTGVISVKLLFTLYYFVMDRDKHVKDSISKLFQNVPKITNVIVQDNKK